MARAFLDTNVLVYADDADAGPKRVKAQSLVLGALTHGDAVISTQVLQEYFAAATRKLSVQGDPGCGVGRAGRGQRASGLEGAQGPLGLVAEVAVDAQRGIGAGGVQQALQPGP
jgi:hypothetical protein